MTTTNDCHDGRPHPSKDETGRRGRDGREAARDTIEPTSQKSTEYELGHSVVTLETGPAGTLARIERVDGVDFAGPLDDETVDALEAVARGESDG